MSFFFKDISFSDFERNQTEFEIPRMAIFFEGLSNLLGGPYGVLFKSIM
jgi:hypothetical protein